MKDALLDLVKVTILTKLLSTYCLTWGSARSYSSKMPSFLKGILINKSCLGYKHSYLFK